MDIQQTGRIYYDEENTGGIVTQSVFSEIIVLYCTADIIHLQWTESELLVF